MIQEGRVESYNAINEHINDFQKMTIFSRIDVSYPDNTALMQSGEKIKIGDLILCLDIDDSGSIGKK